MVVLSLSYSIFVEIYYQTWVKHSVGTYLYIFVLLFLKQRHMIIFCISGSALILQGRFGGKQKENFMYVNIFTEHLVRVFRKNVYLFFPHVFFAKFWYISFPTMGILIYEKICTTSFSIFVSCTKYYISLLLPF